MTQCLLADKHADSEALSDELAEVHELQSNNHNLRCQSSASAAHLLWHLNVPVLPAVIDLAFQSEWSQPLIHTLVHCYELL